MDRAYARGRCSPGESVQLTGAHLTATCASQHVAHATTSCGLPQTLKKCWRGPEDGAAYPSSVRVAGARQPQPGFTFMRGAW